MKRPTIEDVAKRAKVSVTTVSRVLNGHDEKYMRPETRDRVLKAIKQLTFTPVRAAQRLRQRYAQIIGVVLPDLSNPYFSELLRGIQKVAYQEHYSVIIADTNNSVKREKESLKIFIAERVDGVLLVPAAMRNDAVEHFLRQEIPLIIVGRSLTNVKIPSVKADNFKAGYILTEHLLKLGYPKIGFVKGPIEVSTAKERFQGFQEAITDHGRVVDANSIIQGDFTFDGGYQAMMQLLSKGNVPDAIISANELAAIGVIMAAEASGLTVPRDIGVAGFDYLPNTLFAKPALTTVYIPSQEMGEVAANILFQYIRGAYTIIQNRVLDVHLSAGESCAYQAS